jgi:hypothetical protein
MAKDVQVICVKSEPEYFCERGWTCDSAICPPGNPARGNISADTMLSAGLCDYPYIRCEFAL